jgi:hypothetical protein
MENGFFKIETYSPAIFDSVFMDSEGFSKLDSVYFTFGSEYANSLKLEDAYCTIPIEGKSWRGFLHLAPCSQKRMNRSEYEGDICESIYFYDGKYNITKIYTSGTELNEELRQVIIDSFRFY